MNNSNQNDINNDNELKYLKKEYLLNPNSKKSFKNEKEAEFRSDDNIHLSKDHLNQFTLDEEQNVIEKLLSLFNFQKFLQNILVLILKIINLTILSEHGILGKFKNNFKIRSLLKKLFLALQAILLLRLINAILRLQKERSKLLSHSAGKKIEYEKYEEYFKQNEYNEKEHHKHHDRNDNSKSNEHEKTFDEKNREKIQNDNEKLYEKKHSILENFIKNNHNREDSSKTHDAHYQNHSEHTAHSHEPHPLDHFKHSEHHTHDAHHRSKLPDLIEKVKRFIEKIPEYALDLLPTLNIQPITFRGYGDSMPNNYKPSDTFGKYNFPDKNNNESRNRNEEPYIFIPHLEIIYKQNKEIEFRDLGGRRDRGKEN